MVEAPAQTNFSNYPPIQNILTVQTKLAPHLIVQEKTSHHVEGKTVQNSKSSKTTTKITSLKSVKNFPKTKR